jgi:hypothetical protein
MTPAAAACPRDVCLSPDTVLSQWVNHESVRRGIVSDIMRVFEDRQFRLSALQLMNVTVDQLATVYVNQVNRPIWSDLVVFMWAGPGVAMARSRRDRPCQTFWCSFWTRSLAAGGEGGPVATYPTVLFDARPASRAQTPAAGVDRP